MSINLFYDNTSNNYIVPSLAPCSGTSDSNYFEFLSGQQVGIVSGSSILSAMNLGDISLPVQSWVQQTKLLQSGEVTFIQGLTKGLITRTQLYNIDGSVSYYSDLDQYYMSLHMSINYYYNFKYYNTNIHVAADYSNGIDIASAINIELGNRNINMTAYYDASSLTFVGDSAGYEFNVTAIDASRWVPDTSIVGNTLTEDVSSRIPSAKYPNSAMLGYVLKVTYPDSITDETSKYISVNHVPDNLIYYEPSTGDANSYVRYDKLVDVGMNASSTSTIMSAGDYLDYVQSNNKWGKVGLLKMWLAPEDADDSTLENLITGFYVFNPQTYTVKIEYLTLL